MTAFFLMKDLCSYLKKLVDDYAASQNSKGEFVKPTVFDWYLPFKNARSGESLDFPYIAPQIRRGEDEDESTVTIMIYFGVYHESKEINGFTHPDGAYDLLNLMEYVRQALQKQRVINRRFELQKSYKWEIPDEQPYPLWVGQATTLWNVGSIIPDDGGFLHGN